MTYPPLPDGAHIFRVRATDAAGNSGEAQRSFNLDGTAPSAEITSGPSGATANVSPTFVFVGSEVGTALDCRLNEGTWNPCSSPYQLTNLAPGDYIFEIRATDSVENSGYSDTAYRTFTVTEAAAAATITAGPEGSTSSVSATFEFESDQPDAEFECRLDSPSGQGVWSTGCVSPATYTGLSEGLHELQVRATGSSQSTPGPAATRAFVVDTMAPSSPDIHRGPDPTSNTTPTIDSPRRPAQWSSAR